MLVWEFAREQAEMIRTEYPDTTRLDLDDLIDVAHTYGAEVVFRSLNDNTMSVVVLGGEYPLTIYIDNSYPLPMNRYNLAHAIGHVIDRHFAGSKDYSFIDYYPSNTDYDLHEAFADEFASALLVPEAQLNEHLVSGNNFSAARLFGVTVKAIDYRIDRLRKCPNVDSETD